MCICVLGSVYLGVRHVGTLFLRSLYDFLSKNISHHGSFQGFHGREICGANKWDWVWVWVGWDLCVGLLYEHRFAVLIKVSVQKIMVSEKVSVSVKILVSCHTACWSSFWRQGRL